MMTLWKGYLGDEIGIVLGESEVGTVVKIRVSLGSAWWRAKLET